MRARALPAVLAVAATALVLTGCAANNAAGPPAAGPLAPSTAPQQTNDHNQADIAFVQAMIPHHAQAIQMARLAQDRAQSPQVKDLARRIEQAQGPEIVTMAAWLRAWHAAVPPTGPTGMGHGGTGQMPGMMDAEQMQQLGQATGAQFDQMFLQMMIQHHEGAIDMARTELATGQNAKAKQLAEQIITAQQAEIGEMQKLLAQT